MHTDVQTSLFYTPSTCIQLYFSIPTRYTHINSDSSYHEAWPLINTHQSKARVISVIYLFNDIAAYSVANKNLKLVANMPNLALPIFDCVT